MQTRILTNLILFVALIVLISAIIFSQNDQAPVNTLTSLNKDDISNITIHRDKQNIILEKRSNQWFMTQPYAMPAHEFRIQSLLDLPGANSDKHYDTSDIDLDTYGLQTPGAHIQFNNTHIYFGKTNPVTGFRYVQINNTMHLLLDNLYPLIRSQATSFVDLALLPDKAKIKRLNLPDIELVHAQKGWSSSTQNITADQIHTLLQSWHYAKAFATHGYTQRESLGQIKIEFDQHKTIEFSITAEQPWMILARADMGIEYHLDASQKSALLPPLKP